MNIGGTNFTEVEDTCDETFRELKKSDESDPKLSGIKQPFDDHEEIHDKKPVIVK